MIPTVRTMSRTQKITVVVLTLTLMAATAVAFSNVSLTLGNSPNVDFGSNFGGGQPATVQIHTFTMQPGDTIPWHFHKSMSYVVLERGTLSETHVDEGSGKCVSEDFTAGTAFVEQPGEVHTVTNSGKSVAIITWATAFPTSDGLLRIKPQFTVGGLYVVPAPTCS
jgi:quercetin dioxygenase-like cupin family protein